MKALQVTAPGKVEFVEVTPPSPGPGQILLGVRMVGMCGSDLNTFRGRNPLVSYPRILGHEIAATVLSAPPDVDIAPGTHVAVNPYRSCGSCAACRAKRHNACRFNETFGVQRDGALTEFITVPPEKIYPAPGLTLEELALVEPLTVGFHAVARARVSEHDIVLIFGCGGVGLGAIAGAARRGAHVIGADVDDGKLALAQAAGARSVVNSKHENLHVRLQELTGGEGPSVAIEAIGLPETFRAAVEEVSFSGRVVYLGYAKDPVTYETKLFVQKELDILGSRNALPHDFYAVIDMLRERQFPVGQAIGKIVRLAEATSALEEWDANPTRIGKLLVRID